MSKDGTDSKEALFGYIQNGDLKKVKELISESGGIDCGVLSAENGDGQTPLVFAITKNKTDIAIALIEALNPTPKLLTAKNKYGQTALSAAVESGSLEVVGKLEDVPNQKFDVHMLVNAISKKQPDIAKKIIAKLDPKELYLIISDNASPLMLAIKSNQPEIAIAIIGALKNEPRRLNIKDNSGYSALWLALESSQLDVAAMLTEILNNEPNSFSFAMLEAAISKVAHNKENAGKFKDIALAWIEKLTLKELKSKNEKGENLLMIIAKNFYSDELFEIAEALTKKLDDTDRYHTKDEVGNNALMIAASNGNHKLVDLLTNNITLEQLGVKNRRGKDALMLSMTYGARKSYDALSALMLKQKELTRQSDVEIFKDVLMLAIKESKYVAIENLLKNHQDEKFRQTIAEGLMYFVKSTKSDWSHNDGRIPGALIQALSQDAELLRRTMNENNSSILFFAAKNGHDVALDLIKALPKESLNLKNKFGYTPLMVAAQGGHLRIVEALMARLENSEIYEKSNIGQTALMATVGSMENGGEVAEALLGNASAENINIQDDKGNTALMHAILMKNFDVAEALIKKLPPEYLNAVNKAGNTALMIAAVKSNGAEYLVPRLMNKLGIGDFVSMQNDGFDKKYFVNEDESCFSNNTFMISQKTQRENIIQKFIREIAQVQDEGSASKEDALVNKVFDCIIENQKIHRNAMFATASTLNVKIINMLTPNLRKKVYEKIIIFQADKTKHLNLINSTATLNPDDYWGGRRVLSDLLNKKIDAIEDSQVKNKLRGQR